MKLCLDKSCQRDFRALAGNNCGSSSTGSDLVVELQALASGSSSAVL